MAKNNSLEEEFHQKYIKKDDKKKKKMKISGKSVLELKKIIDNKNK